MTREAGGPVWGCVAARVAVVGGMALGASCAPASAPPALPVFLAPAASSVGGRSASAPPALALGWLKRGVSSPGIPLAKGRLALVDGVRTLIADDGALRQATDVQRLDSLVVVPGTAGPVVVGVAGRSVVRFDDPLGAGVPIARAATDIKWLGAWPGLVSVSTAKGTLWFDLDGRPRPSPMTLSPSSSAFLDARIGMAVFPVSGPALTRDGGATWSLTDAAEVVSGALRGEWMSDCVDLEQGWFGLRAIPWDIREADAPSRFDATWRVDVATGGVSRAGLEPLREPPFVRWLRRAGDPLVVAVGSGVLLSPTRALVAFEDLMAEVDLTTGLPVAFTSIANVHDPSWKPSREAWDATPFRRPSGERGAYLWNAGLLLQVDLDVPRGVDRIVRAWRTKDRPVASSSGGWMVGGECPGDTPAPAEVSCVLQPDGSRKSVRARLAHAGPRADGGLLGLRNDEGGLAIVAVDPTGKQRTLAQLPLEDGERFDVVHQLDELPTGALFGAYELHRGEEASKAGAMVVRGQAVELVPFPFDDEPRVHCHVGHCLGFWDRTLASFDLAAGVWRVARGSGFPSDDSVSSSEVGWSMGYHWVHMGWAPGDLPPPYQAAPRAAPEPALSIVCDSGPPRAGSLPYLPAVEGDPVDIYKAVVPRAVAARERQSQTYGIGEALGVLSTDADPDVETSRGTLSLHWVDHTELGAHARHAALPGWSGSFPYVTRLVASRHHAVFVSGPEQSVAGRVIGGRLELTPFTRSQPHSGAFSADGAFAWLCMWTEIGHWPARGTPRVLASVSRGSAAVAAPTAEGVPVMAYDDGWAVLRVVPVSGPPPGRLDVAGWRPTPFSLDALATLPVCARDAPGYRFSLDVDVDVVLPGPPLDVRPHSELAVRVSPDSACLDGVFFEQRDRFARIDLRGGVAEGGEAGLRGRVTSLTCRVKRLAHVGPAWSRRARAGGRRTRPTTSRASARPRTWCPPPTRPAPRRCVVGAERRVSECVTSAIEVGRQSGRCVGTEIPASNAPPRLRQNHCGSTNAGAGGAPVHVLGCG